MAEQRIFVAWDTSRDVNPILAIIAEQNAVQAAEQQTLIRSPESPDVFFTEAALEAVTAQKRAPAVEHREGLLHVVDSRLSLIERLNLAVWGCDYYGGPIQECGCTRTFHCGQGKGGFQGKPFEVTKADCYRCVTGQPS